MMDVITRANLSVIGNSWGLRMNTTRSIAKVKYYNTCSKAFDYNVDHIMPPYYNLVIKEKRMN